jgi:hypothetical protein
MIRYLPHPRIGIPIVIILTGFFTLACASTPSTSQPTATATAASTRTSAGAASAAAGSFAVPDETIRQLFRAIEEQRVEVFTDLIALDCDPPRDILWRNLNAFIGEADQIEFVVQVERRMQQEKAIVYVFSWQRKYLEKETDRIITTRGQGEWTLVKSRGDEYLLRRMQGNPVF